MDSSFHKMGQHMCSIALLSLKLGSITAWGSLHVSLAFLGDLCGYFCPQSKDMDGDKLIGDFKLSAGLNVIVKSNPLAL